MAVGIVARVLARACSWDTLVFYRRGVEGSIIPHRASEPLTIRLAEPEEVLGWAEPLAMTPAQIRHSLSVGDLYFAALVEGRLVHLTWLARTIAWLPDLYASFPLGSTEAYLANSFTAPEHRGRGIQPAVIQAVFRHEVSLGIDWQLAYVRKSNPSAARTLQKHGSAIQIWKVRVGRLAGVRGRWIAGLGQPGLPRMEFPEGFTTWKMGRLGLWLRPPVGQRLGWTMVPPSYGP